jgi:hypothetical protein
MMELLVASLLAFGLSILAMAVGLLFGRARITGSCGGLAELCERSGRKLCEFCPHQRPSGGTER